MCVGLAHASCVTGGVVSDSDHQMDFVITLLLFQQIQALTVPTILFSPQGNYTAARSGSALATESSGRIGFKI